MPILFLIGGFGGAAMMLIIASYGIYADSPPPNWMLWPAPPLMLCVIIGVAQLVSTK